MNSDISFPSHRENRFYQGRAATFVANAYYPRDFAWFYPDVLDPETIICSARQTRS
jgi:hypothetical protein